MMVPAALLLLGALTAVLAPRLLARAQWPDREPVVALWAWQCVVGATLLCLALSMLLSAAAAWQAVRGGLFAAAPHGVVDAYALGAAGGPWAAGTALALACGGLWTGAMLTREVLRARARRRTTGPNCCCARRCCPARTRRRRDWWCWRVRVRKPGGSRGRPRGWS